jgi:hypothetical protein
MKNKPYRVFEFINMHEGNKEVCWEWKGYLDGVGRPCFDVQGRKVTAYRLAYELFHNVKLPRGILLRHKCDNQVCCNPHHLEEGTHKDNMRDMRERQRHGIAHHAVRQIRKLLAKGDLTHQQIADTSGVSRDTIGRIARGEAYAHVSTDDSGELVAPPESSKSSTLPKELNNDDISTEQKHLEGDENP